MSDKGRSLRSPLVRFFALAALGHAAGLIADGAVPPRSEHVAIRITEADLLRAGRDPLARRAALATATLPAPVVDQLIDDSVLWHEAVRRGMHRNDSIVRRRLIGSMRFLGAAPGTADETLFQSALRLGMHRSDLVASRRLIERARLDILAGTPQDELSAPALEAWLARSTAETHAGVFVRFSQIYVRDDGPRATDTAERLLERLRGEAISPGRCSGYGHATLYGTTVAGTVADDVRTRFGPRFAQAIATVETGSWQGPLPSGHGLHLVWIHVRRPLAPYAAGAGRRALREAWLLERERAWLEARLEKLRKNYVIQLPAAYRANPTAGADTDHAPEPPKGGQAA